jgi:cellulose biosynthesis protein BcsQ
MMVTCGSTADLNRGLRVLFLLSKKGGSALRQRMVLCDSDRDYSLRIAGYVRESEFRKEVELIVFSNPDTLNDWLQRETFDVLIVSLEFAASLEHEVTTEGLIWITDGEGGIGPRKAPLQSKYESLPRLLRGWLRHSRRKGSMEGQRDAGASIVAIWSAGGGVGKTKLASSLSGVWAERGLGTFVIGLDPGIYEKADRFPAAFHDVSDWLYAIKSGKDLESWTRGASATSRIHYFLPDSPYREFIGLGRNEGAELLKMASTAFGCHFVLVELGSGWSPFTEEVWSRADVLLCVSTPDELCLRKTDKWLREWSLWSEQPAFREKTIFTVNKSLADTATLSPEWAEQAFRLPYVPEWKQSGERTDPLFQRRLHCLAEELWQRCRSD